MMDFDNMTKEELIIKLRELEKHRAFSYEDQMKLAILDKSPFTIWASDRDCRITLWEGQCEVLYGYTRDFAIGKDYVSLFVAPDEQPAARRDQISIIDEAAIFHNIANDIAKYGNTLRLVTNCFRIKDPLSDKYWNAEMGLIIDYLDQEKERLELIIAESRKVKFYTNLFIDKTNQCKMQYQARKKAIRTAIAESQRKAAFSKRLNSFREKITPINAALESLQYELNQLIDDYYQKIQACADADSCEKTMLDFNETYDEMIYGFEEIVVNFEDINSEFSWDNTVMQLRDDLLKYTFERSRRLEVWASELLKKAEDDINDYRRIGDVKPDAHRLVLLTRRRDNIQIIKEEIITTGDETIPIVQRSNDSEKLAQLRKEIEKRYSLIEDKLSSAKKEMEAVA